MLCVNLYSTVSSRSAFHFIAEFSTFFNSLSLSPSENRISTFQVAFQSRRALRTHQRSRCPIWHCRRGSNPGRCRRFGKRRERCRPGPPSRKRAEETEQRKAKEKSQKTVDMGCGGEEKRHCCAAKCQSRQGDH